VMQGGAGINQVEFAVGEAVKIGGILGEATNSAGGAVGGGAAQSDLDGDRREIEQSHASAFGSHQDAPLAQSAAIVERRESRQRLGQKLLEYGGVEPAAFIEGTVWLLKVAEYGVTVGTEGVIRRLTMRCIRRIVERPFLLSRNLQRKLYTARRTPAAAIRRSSKLKSSLRRRCRAYQR